MYKNEERMIKFLQGIADDCDLEASDMLKVAEKENTQFQIDAMVYSSMIMNVNLYCKNMIDKSLFTKHNSSFKTDCSKFGNKKLCLHPDCNTDIAKKCSSYNSPL